MSFFEPPPPPPPPEQPEPSYRHPDWMGPHRNVLGMPVGVRLILVQTEKLLIAVVGMTAFPTGLRFDVVMLSQDDALDEVLMKSMRGFHPGMEREVDEEGQFQPWVFRLGVEFADGRRATNVGAPMRPWLDEESDPEGPLLQDHGGGGGGGHWSRQCWLWPLPPPGRLIFVCEWPALGVAETRVETSAAAILAAADQSVELWEDDPERPPEGHAGIIRMTSRRAPAKPPPDEPEGPTEVG